MQQHLDFTPANAAGAEAGGGLFHPAVAGWFASAFGEPTEVQHRAWQATSAHRHTLIAAPTGSGKTLAAFMAAINDLVVEGLAQGLGNEVHVLYVSPLKALSNDIQKNLQAPLEGIRRHLLEGGWGDVAIRDAVRTGDTTSFERASMRRTPPHILVTTPESLFILLTSDSGRAMLSRVRSVIVDELHAVAGSKRGAHLMLSLERLDALCEKPPTRIGLSATQKPIEVMAALLLGDREARCEVIDVGHARRRDLAIDLPASPLSAVMANEVWSEIYDRLAALGKEHRTTLVFVNQRRLAERAARHLAERLGAEHVTAHHGSLAREHRLDAEQRLKAGKLRMLITTSSLELGIDIGDVDLVCQLGSPRSIAAFLQRVGRSGHAVHATPKGRLFPLSLDDLAECAALLDSVRRGELDRIRLPDRPLDVLAQQIIAEVACREWPVDALYRRLRRAEPYRALDKQAFLDVVHMLADGFATRRGRRGAYLHFDQVNGVLRGRRGAKLAAVTNAGTIPDQFDQDVILMPEGLSIGSLNEDFAFESIPGDIFQLGNTSYRMLKIETGKVYVENADGAPPNIPFWFGEAPGRSDELSLSVSRLRDEAGTKLEQGVEACERWLREEPGLSAAAADQLARYLAAAHAALGCLPTQQRIVFERFFDEAGDTHLVVHAPFGSRINRAWGLALRKKFCRQFDFELQASALEDSLVLSLGPTHSFPLEEPVRYVKSAGLDDVLVQAVLQAPMFPTRWRWVASVSLAVKRNLGGKRVLPQFQRMDAEDLLTVVFPDAVACQDNLPGDREVPEHPLIGQTLHDCLHEVMDIDGLRALLLRIEAGEVEVVCRELTEPSPLSGAIVNARPYAFLDDGAAEERRTLAVRMGADPLEAADLSRLDPEAIDRVRQEIRPQPTDADELHDALTVHGCLTAAEGAAWQRLFDILLTQRRVVTVQPENGELLWVAAERLPEVLAAIPQATVQGDAPMLRHPPAADVALVELLRGRLDLTGPVTEDALRRPLGLASVDAALAALQAEGYVMRGRYTGGEEEEWCERRLLARIHRYTRDRLRAEIQPVSPAQFMRHLFAWQSLEPEAQREGDAGLAIVLEQLEGFPAAADTWENDLLPARIKHYFPEMLDALCASGQIVWQRPALRGREETRRKSGPVRSTPILLVGREHAAFWRAENGEQPPPLSSRAQRVLEALRAHGASFLSDLVHDAGLLRSEIEQALAELVSHGLVASDRFAGLRALITPAERKARYARRRRKRGLTELDEAGRWALVRHRRPAETSGALADPRVEHIARALLKRYGVVFRKLLERETGLPPWRELFYVYRRLEARGEIRGGRFVNGFAGEQFALPGAVQSIKNIRKQPPDDSLITLSATDPLNLLGIILAGERVPAVPGNRILFRGGAPIAIRAGGDITWLEKVDPTREWELRSALLRRARTGHGN